MPNKTPKCKKSTYAVNEKKAHHGKPCKKNEERTKNFCVKKLSTNNKTTEENNKWYRTISPNKNTRIIIACPK